MNLKKIIPATVLMGVVTFSMNAQAKTEAKALFDQNYPGNTTACTVCHISANGKPLTAYGTGYVGAGGQKAGTLAAIKKVEELDPDFDTINNGLEIRSGTDPNSPDTITGALGTSTEASGDVLVQGSSVGTVTVTALTDAYSELGLTLASGQEILSNVKVSFLVGNLDPLTITYAKDSPSGTVKVHEVTGLGSVNTVSATSSSSGSVTFTPTVTNLTIAIEHTPAVQATDSGGGGCLTDSLSAPLTLLFTMLTLGFFARKRD